VPTLSKEEVNEHGLVTNWIIHDKLAPHVPIREGYITTHCTYVCRLDHYITLCTAPPPEWTTSYSRDNCNKKVSACSEAKRSGHYSAVKYTMHRTDAYVQFQCNYIKNNKQHLTVESEGRESLFMHMYHEHATDYSWPPIQLPCLPDVYSAVAGSRS